MILFVWDFPTLYISSFIRLFSREPNVCHVVSIRKREDPGNKSLGMSVCEWRPLFGHYNSRVSSVGELFRLVSLVRLIYKVRRNLT